MTTPIQQKIRDKKRTPEQIAGMVKSGDWINHGTMGGDSTVCSQAVARRLGPGPGQLRDIEIWLHGNPVPRPEFQEIDPLEQYHCMHNFFMMPWNRKARDTNKVSDWAQWGWAYGIWAYHYRFANATRENRGIDWWFNAATVPDHHGFFNMSYGTSNSNVYRQTAKKIVFEVRSDYPWAEGGRFNTIHIDEIDYWVEVDCAKHTWPQVDERGIKPKPEEEAIARHIMTIMRDRDVVQLGIGSLPSACIAAMADAGFKDLGIHTEMLNFGLIKLIESGQVTNAYKNLDNGKSVYTFAFPFDSQWYYDTIHRNQRLAAYDSGYTNNLQNITRIDNMIAIDNCVAVDLLGQQCCSFYEMRPISGTGGFLHFVIFAGHSRGGRGVAAITSRSKKGTSRIVPFLPTGSTVDVPAQFTQYVCTEYGIVNLRGLSGYERASALISIAHPDDRAWLDAEARKHGLIAPKFPVSMYPEEGGGRRYPSYDDRRNYKLPLHSEIWGFDWDPFQSGK
ncbi:MAG: acetyl-CoA hydrolase/transferase C-terminal domain-containing protein [Syntrophales bacterium]|nr:acetyl-CoA hydrolase/transferase C-terminal domain-containing protein [Syntrophales bacterium]